MKKLFIVLSVVAVLCVGGVIAIAFYFLDELSKKRTEKARGARWPPKEPEENHAPKSEDFAEAEVVENQNQNPT